MLNLDTDKKKLEFSDSLNRTNYMFLIHIGQAIIVNKAVAHVTYLVDETIYHQHLIGHNPTVLM